MGVGVNAPAPEPPWNWPRGIEHTTQASICISSLSRTLSLPHSPSPSLPGLPVLLPPRCLVFPLAFRCLVLPPRVFAVLPAGALSHPHGRQLLNARAALLPRGRGHVAQAHADTKLDRDWELTETVVAGRRKWWVCEV